MIKIIDIIMMMMVMMMVMMVTTVEMIMIMIMILIEKYDTILKKKTFELRKFIKTREMATDHEITTLNLMSDVGILGIDTRNSFANCYYSLSR